MLGWTSKRSRANSAPPFRSRWSRQHPILHYIWQQMQAEFLPYASISVLERDMLHLSYSVSAADDARVRCNELATERSLSFSALKRRTSACGCGVVDVRLSMSSSPLNRGVRATCARFDMLAFRFPSCDNEQSNVHAHVAAAEFLMNFRTHQICLSCTDSDNAILQHETETTHVSRCPHLLHSEPAALGLYSELPTNGVERSARFSCICS